MLQKFRPLARNAAREEHEKDTFLLYKNELNGWIALGQKRMGFRSETGYI